MEGEGGGIGANVAHRQSPSLTTLISPLHSLFCLPSSSLRTIALTGTGSDEEEVDLTRAVPFGRFRRGEEKVGRTGM